MSTEIREWLTEIWEYCQEHWITVAAAAAVVLVLLVSFVLILAAKRDDDREDIEVPEAETVGAGELPEPDEPSAVTEVVGDEPENVPTEAEPEPEAAAEESASEEIVDEPEEAVETAAAVCAQSAVEELVKQVEAISGASGQKVESIELKIEKARLTIRYAGAPSVTETLTPEDCCKEEITEAQAVPDGEPVLEDPAVLQKPDSGESVKPKKFGVENMNRARSGRVYTEEELLNQIRE